MTADDASLVTASFSRVVPTIDPFVARFYERLFERRPDVRSLFPLELGPQRGEPPTVIQLAVDNLRRPARLVPILEDLGLRHAAYGVREADFEDVGQALMGALGRSRPPSGARRSTGRGSTPTSRSRSPCAGGCSRRARPRGRSDWHSLPAGTVLGGFRLLSELGRGGMATVFRAEDVRLGRHVAVKVVDPALAADPRFRARFEREARVTASVTHPNIVTTLLAGEEGRVLFLVLELDPGARWRRASARRRCRGGTGRGSAPRWRARSRRSTRAASCTATSSRRTCSSTRRATPSSRTSAWSSPRRTPSA